MKKTKQNKRQHELHLASMSPATPAPEKPRVIVPNQMHVGCWLWSQTLLYPVFNHQALKKKKKQRI